MSKHVATKDVEFNITPNEKINLTKGDVVAAPSAVLARLLKHGIVEKVVEIADGKKDIEAAEYKVTENTFADMKKKELQKFLDDAGIEYESDANRDRLIQLAIDATEPVQD